MLTKSVKAPAWMLYHKLMTPNLRCANRANLISGEPEDAPTSACPLTIQLGRKALEDAVYEEVSAEEADQSTED